MPTGKIDFDPHARYRMRRRLISEYEVLLVLQRGVRSPEAADAAASPRFSYRGLVAGRWIKVVAMIEEDRMLVLTVIDESR
jgi:hypothetical protein